MVRGWPDRAILVARDAPMSDAFAAIAAEKQGSPVAGKKLRGAVLIGELVPAKRLRDRWPVQRFASAGTGR